MLDAFLSANPKDQVTTKRSREPSSSLLMGYDFIIKEFNPLVISDDDHGEEQFSRVQLSLRAKLPRSLVMDAKLRSASANMRTVTSRK